MRVLYFFVRAFDNYFPIRIRQKKKSLVLVARKFPVEGICVIAVMHVHLQSYKYDCIKTYYTRSYGTNGYIYSVAWRTTQPSLVCVI
jgi:hypothetical protein